MDGSPSSQLLAVAVTVLEQAIDLVENVLISDEQLTTQSKYLPGSTIGVYSMPPSFLAHSFARMHARPNRKTSPSCAGPLHSPHRERIRIGPAHPLL
jgi:hypothetical protein